MYVTEWSPVNIRGAMVLAYGFWNRFGSFLAPLTLTLVQETRPLNYRIPILTQWGFLGLMLPIFLWIPESPAYCAAKGNDDRGKAGLRRINGAVKGYDVEKEYAIIKHTILEERAALEEVQPRSEGVRQITQSYLDCFRGPNALRTLGAALPVCAQKLTGLSFLNTYASVFFRQSEFTNAFLITTILSKSFLPVCLSGWVSAGYGQRTDKCNSNHRTRQLAHPHPTHRPLRPPPRRRLQRHHLHIHHAHRRHPRFRAQNRGSEELSHLHRLHVVIFQYRT